MTTLEIEAIKHSKKVYEGVIKPTPFIDGMCHGGKRGFIEGAEWMKERAIKAACYSCIQSGVGCGHIDRDDNHYLYCDQLEDFKKSINV